MLRAANGKPVEGKMEATTEKRGQGSGREEGGKGAATAAACFLDSLSTYLPCQSGPRDRPPLDRRVILGLQISGSLEAHAHSLSDLSKSVPHSATRVVYVRAATACGGAAGGRTDGR